MNLVALFDLGADQLVRTNVQQSHPLHGPQSPTPSTSGNTLRFLTESIRPGMTLDELDSFAFGVAIDNGMYPASLNYRAWRWTLCRVNDQLSCYDIPADEPLRERDVVWLEVCLTSCNDTPDFCKLAWRTARVTVSGAEILTESVHDLDGPYSRGASAR